MNAFVAQGAGELLTDEAPRRVEVKADREDDIARNCEKVRD